MNAAAASSNTVSIVLVGLGGYGEFYIRALCRRPRDKAFRIVGAVDPCPERCTLLSELDALAVPRFASLEEFHRGRTADVAIISSPIHFHCPQTAEALARGSHVLCEKPAAATVQDVRRMMEARDGAGRQLAIGYQWSYSAAIQALKRDLLAGHLGRPLRFRTLVLWPRNAGYYARNSWAGARDDGGGRWILDSPLNNACAHYLHNMLFVLGSGIDRSAAPLRVTAELYRANAITNYDTAVARGVAEGGAEFVFCTSHAVPSGRGPEFVLECENAVVRFSEEETGIVAAFKNGTRRSYGDPSADPENKVWNILAASRGEDRVACGLEAAGMQTLCMNGIQESVPAIAVFPAGVVDTQGDGPNRVTFVRGLADWLARCYEEARLPSELGAPWAAPGREVDLAGYDRFPSNEKKRIIHFPKTGGSFHAQ